MITLSGQLYNINQSDYTDPKTGEVKSSFVAEILHKSKGKTEVASVKLEPENAIQWKKIVGQPVSFEVSFYAMKTASGDVMKGLTLADKKALPLISRVQQTGTTTS